MASPFTSAINQLGCVVRDLDNAIDGWIQLGIGPFLTMRNVGLSDYVYEGKPSRPKIDVAFGQNGDLQIELIQPTGDEPSSYRDFLAGGSEGIHHLGWFPDEYEGVVAAMEKGCGDCMIGCGRGAKNMVTENYLFLAEKLGATVHELQEVYELEPLQDGGYEVRARHPGWAQRAVAADHRRYTAEQVIVAAHAYGTSQLLLHMQHTGKLANLSDEAGKRARTNSEALISVQRSEADYKQHPERVHIVPGTSSVTACIQADEESTMGPVYYGVGSNAMALLYTSPAPGAPDHPLRNWLEQLVSHPLKTLSVDDPRNWSQRGFNMLCMRDHDDWLDLYWKDGMLRSKPGSKGAPPTFLEIANEVGKQIAAKLGGQMAQTWFAVAGKATSSHFIGGMTIADSPAKGAIDPYQRVFGHPGLHIMDGSAIAANPGVNPSLTIAALAERAMSFWPNKGETDPRPPLGSGYNRISPVLPHHAAVPAGAPTEYRLSATSVSDLTVTYQPTPRSEPRAKSSPADGFRVLGDAGELGDNSVEPFYFEDLKRRVSASCMPSTTCARIAALHCLRDCSQAGLS